MFTKENSASRNFMLAAAAWLLFQLSKLHRYTSPQCSPIAYIEQRVHRRQRSVSSSHKWVLSHISVVSNVVKMTVPCVKEATRVQPS